jgi:hypothetical protein
MNEALDPLEAELSQLRPPEISPELRRRVAECLADSPQPSRRTIWRLAFAAGLAAALLLSALVWQGRKDRKVTPAPESSAFVHDSRPRPETAAQVPAWPRDLDETEPPRFVWPLKPTLPVGVSASVPADLLE